MRKQLTLASASIVLSSLIIFLNGCADKSKPAAESLPTVEPTSIAKSESLPAATSAEPLPAVTSSPSGESSLTAESSPSTEASPGAESSLSAESSPSAEDSLSSESSPSAESSPNAESSLSAESSPSAESAAAGAELAVEAAILAKQDESTGKLEPIENGVFQKGDQVNLVLVNVGKFEKGDDGKNRFDLDIQVKDSQGEVIGAQESVLGDQGHIALPNDIAKSPVGFVDATTTEKLDPGEYTIEITVRDKIGGDSVSRSKTFTLQ